MNAIRTTYRGTKYRSRLEARWAAFFDLVGWRYEYEPCDFNGWIPDFALLGRQVVYVEVKPIYSFPEDIAIKMLRSGCRNSTLLVGLSPQLYCEDWFNLDGEEISYQSGPWFGWMPSAVGRIFTFDHAEIRLCPQKLRLDLCNASHMIGFLFGFDGSKFPSKEDERTKEYTASKWAEAKNLTQWGSDIAVRSL